MSSRHSGYRRIDDDFHVEPDWCIDQMLDTVSFTGAIHDPCCGSGNIVDAALNRGLVATGSDIADRADGRFPVVDFLVDRRRHANFVFNPPYRSARRFLEHALSHLAPGGLLRFFGEVERGNGSTDFCWVVFRPDRDRTTPVEIGWLAP